MKKLLFILFFIPIFSQAQWINFYTDHIIGYTKDSVLIDDKMYYAVPPTLTKAGDIVHKGHLDAALDGIVPLDSNNFFRTKSDFETFGSITGTLGGSLNFTLPVITSQFRINSNSGVFAFENDNDFSFTDGVTFVFTNASPFGGENIMAFGDSLGIGSAILGVNTKLYYNGTPTLNQDHDIITLGIMNSALSGFSSLDSARIYDSLGVHRDSINAISSYAHGLDFLPTSGTKTLTDSLFIKTSGRGLMFGTADVDFPFPPNQAVLLFSDNYPTLDIGEIYLGHDGTGTGFNPMSDLAIRWRSNLEAINGALIKYDIDRSGTFDVRTVPDVGWVNNNFIKNTGTTNINGNATIQLGNSEFFRIYDVNGEPVLLITTDGSGNTLTSIKGANSSGNIGFDINPTGSINITSGKLVYGSPYSSFINSGDVAPLGVLDTLLLGDRITSTLKNRSAGQNGWNIVWNFDSLKFDLQAGSGGVNEAYVAISIDSVENNTVSLSSGTDTFTGTKTLSTDYLFNFGANGAWNFQNGVTNLAIVQDEAVISPLQSGRIYVNAAITNNAYLFFRSTSRDSTASIGYNYTANEMDVRRDNGDLAELGVATPQEDQHAVTKLYVDDLPPASLTDGAPTTAQLNALFTSPVTGHTYKVKDSDGTGLVYIAIYDGTGWYTFPGILAP